MLNGSSFGNFRPTRGIHQGDPLLPTLFIICPKMLSRLLIREENNGRLKGIKVGWEAPSISHFLVVDNFLLFAKATL